MTVQLEKPSQVHVLLKGYQPPRPSSVSEAARKAIYQNNSFAELGKNDGPVKLFARFGAAALLPALALTELGVSSILGLVYTALTVPPMLLIDAVGVLVQIGSASKAEKIFQASALIVKGLDAIQENLEGTFDVLLDSSGVYYLLESINDRLPERFQFLFDNDIRDTNSEFVEGGQSVNSNASFYYRGGTGGGDEVDPALMEEHQALQGQDTHSDGFPRL